MRTSNWQGKQRPPSTGTESARAEREDGERGKGWETKHGEWIRARAIRQRCESTKAKPAKVREGHNGKGRTDKTKGTG